MPLMFFRQLFQRKERKVSLIGAGTRITGDMKFHGDLRVDGEIHGAARADDEFATLVVSEQGLINGGATASHLLLNGAIVGATAATGRLELRTTARITGDIEYGDITIEQGAIVQGRLTCLHSEPPQSVELTQIASTQALRFAKI